MLRRSPVKIDSRAKAIKIIHTQNVYAKAGVLVLQLSGAIMSVSTFHWPLFLKQLSQQLNQLG
jgi:hypothetical protein